VNENPPAGTTPESAAAVTTDISLLARDRSTVKRLLTAAFEKAVDDLLDAADAPEAAERSLELAVWAEMLPLIQKLLAVAWGILCRRATSADLEKRGLGPERVRLRLEDDYWLTITSTAGPVPVPLFAYREDRGVSSTTRVPARDEVFALHTKTRSSELCLEWEARFGSRVPFREAQELLGFVSHGAVTLEDNTINAHMTAVGALVPPDWLYRPPHEIREILRTRAARDWQTNRPILYASTDAHALRLLTDETWSPAWKMANGIRLWCVDRRTGGVIHIGGEYTWGDCHEVATIVRRLQDSGHLPADGDYGEGVVAALALVTDGLEWLRDHFLSFFSTALLILDAHHAWTHLVEYAAKLWNAGTKKAQQFLDRAYQALLGASRRSRTKSKRERRGHKKQPAHKTYARKVAAQKRRKLRATAGAAPLLALLAESEVPVDKQAEHDALVKYITNNADRMDYATYASRGFQIGSGAMESLHRTAGQIRMKRPGAGWLPETSQAVFNLRMLDLVGRWDEYWAHPGRTARLRAAFGATPTPKP
jgi:hypothetical protein